MPITSSSTPNLPNGNGNSGSIVISVSNAGSRSGQNVTADVLCSIDDPAYAFDSGSPTPSSNGARSARWDGESFGSGTYTFNWTSSGAPTTAYGVVVKSGDSVLSMHSGSIPGVGGASPVVYPPSRGDAYQAKAVVTPDRGNLSGKLTITLTHLQDAPRCYRVYLQLADTSYGYGGPPSQPLPATSEGIAASWNTGDLAKGASVDLVYHWASATAPGTTFVAAILGGSESGMVVGDVAGASLPSGSPVGG